METFQRNTDLCRSFAEQFNVRPVVKTADMNGIFFVRHEVYCRELGFERENAQQQETDAYDQHALHCMISCAQEPSRIVGCSRLILTPAVAPATLLPFELACRGQNYRDGIHPQELPREKIGEYSRLAILPEFRGVHKATPKNGRSSAISKSALGPAPILLGLYLGTLALAQRHAIEYIFIMSEMRLTTLLSRMGIRIKAIAAPVEHRGQRQAAMLRTSEIIEDMPKQLHALWLTIRQQINAAYAEPSKNDESRESACHATIRLRTQSLCPPPSAFCHRP